MTDFQKSRVYAWERTLSVYSESSSIPFHQCQDEINEIWKELGLTNPPKVRLLTNRATTIAARANRDHVDIKESGTDYFILLHELSHSLTSYTDGMTDNHGEDFVGVFIRLLCQFTDLTMLEAVGKAGLHKVKFNLAARFWLLDR